jgi:hypothetical protein
MATAEKHSDSGRLHAVHGRTPVTMGVGVGHANKVLLRAQSKLNVLLV